MEIPRILRAVTTRFSVIVIVCIAVTMFAMPNYFEAWPGWWVALGLIGFAVFRVQYPPRSWTLADTVVTTLFAILGPAGLAVSIWFLFQNKDWDWLWE